MIRRKRWLCVAWAIAWGAGVVACRGGPELGHQGGRIHQISCERTGGALTACDAKAAAICPHGYRILGTQQEAPGERLAIECISAPEASAP